MPRRIPLNLYLLRSDATPATAVSSYRADEGVLPAEGSDVVDSGTGWQRTWILDGEGSEAPLPNAREAPPALLLRSSPAPRNWQSLVNELVPAAAVVEDQSNFGALLFQAVATDVVVWAFGNGWAMLDPSQTVERFGLRAGLNALLSSPVPIPPPKRPRVVGVRELTSAVRAAVVRRSTVLTARPASPSTMERVDPASDAASMAELTTNHDIFDRIAAGRSLRFEAEATGLSQLEAYASEAIRLFRRDDYTKSDDYSWIDYTVPVSDRTEIDRVVDEMFTRALASPPGVVDLVWADSDPDSGLTPAFVCFPNERATRSSSKRTELTWATALQSLQAKTAGAPGSQVLRTSMRFYLDDLSLVGQPELWQLLVAQVAVGADTYIVSDGSVWRASPSYISNVDSLLSARASVNPSYLPAYLGGEKEGRYNTRASSIGKHFLLDKRLGQVPGETPFEPCDLLTADGAFVHVKRKTSSKTMSHVLNQALVSTQMLRSVPAARDRLDLALVSADPPNAALQAMRDHVASFASRPTGTVVIAIIGSWRGIPDIAQLPLLTRIGLNSWLRQMPCECEIVLVGTA